MIRLAPPARLPAPLRALVIAGLSLLLALVIVGGLLSLAGAFRQSTVVGGTLLLGFAIGRVLWRAGEPEGSPMPRGIAAAAVAIALVLAALNAANSAQHTIVDRDPGVYNTAGLLLAQEGTAVIDPYQEQFDAPGFRGRVHSGTLGFEYSGGRLRPQYANALPEALAVAHWVGGSFLLYKANALLGGFALLVFFAFAARLLDPRLALAATAVLGVNPVFDWFARDAYSEILALTFVFGGLWVLMQARESESISGRFAAGLLMGATLATRIDAVLILLGLAAFLCVEWLGARPLDAPGRAERERAVGLVGLGARLPVTTVAHRRLQVYATAAGAIAMIVLALIGAAILSSFYLRSNVDSLMSAVNGLLVLLALTAAFHLGRGRLRPLTARVVRQRESLSRIAGAAVVVLGLYALLVAPEVETRTAGPYSTPTYGEETVQWMGWYAGVPTMLAGVLGLGALTYLALSGRNRHALPALLVFASQGLYFWDAHITPDQIWAMRRFLPVVIPIFVLGAAAAAGILLSQRRVAGRRPLAWLAAALLLVVALLPPLEQVRSLTARTQVPMRTETENLCKALSSAAAVVVPGKDVTAIEYTPIIRATCRIPVGIGDGRENMAFYRRASQAARRVTRQLYVVSSGRLPYRVPRAKIIDAWVDELERVIGTRPKKTVPRHIVIWIARI